MNNPATLDLYRVFPNSSPIEYAAADEEAAIAFKVIELLNGLPLSQALRIVAELVPSLLTSTHEVNTSNDRYQQLSRV